jgi:CubicO group peptidase (beta-lactamase class C family)
VNISQAVVSGAWQLRRGSELVAEDAVGFADAAEGRRCTLSTRFQAASISKQLVAACVLLLEEEGALAISDPVRSWWDAAPSTWGGMTIGHLLANSAGLPHWTAPLDEPGNVPASDEVPAQLCRTPLVDSPGERWSYSGPGYVLAAAIVERAAGQPYGRVVHDRILAPLAMSATSSGWIPAPDEIAHGHRDGREISLLAGLTGLPGTGDLWSTAADLLRFAAACLDRRLLSSRSWSRLTRVHAPLGSEHDAPDETGLVTVGYGYGVYVGTIDGRSIRYHTGDNPGYRSILAWLPDDGLSFCALCNDEAASLPHALSNALTNELEP